MLGYDAQARQRAIADLADAVDETMAPDGAIWCRAYLERLADAQALVELLDLSNVVIHKSALGLYFLDIRIGCPA